MGIDTSALFNTENNKPVQPVLTASHTRTLKSNKNPSEGRTGAENIIQEANTPTRLQREAERKKQKEQQHAAGLQEYQQNIQRAGSLRTDILKAAAAGQDTTTLLLKAGECISLMTGDAVFYKTLQETIRAIHGRAYLDPAPLQQQYEEIRQRRQKLQAALTGSSTDREKHLLRKAIQEHEKQLQDLEENINAENDRQ